MLASPHQPHVELQEKLLASVDLDHLIVSYLLGEAEVSGARGEWAFRMQRSIQADIGKLPQVADDTLNIDDCRGDLSERGGGSVSYTHLTLPTKRIV